MFGEVGQAELLAAMHDSQRDERSAVARRLFAVGHYALRRLSERGDEHADWCVDDWELVAAEVGCHLGISRGRASTQLREGTALIERLPRLGATLAVGDVDHRIVAAAITRTALVLDREVLAEIDAELAKAAPTWNALSRKRISELVDWLVVERDPEAVRVARQRDADRSVDITPADHGMAEVWGHVRSPDAAALDQRLDELAATVCADDPRTVRQRRADALGPLAAGASTMPCLCGSDDCPAGDAPEKQPQVVIHVLVEAPTLDGASERPAYVPGYGTLPAEAVRDLAGRATLQPIMQPPGSPAKAEGAAGCIPNGAGPESASQEAGSPEGGAPESGTAQESPPQADPPRSDPAPDRPPQSDPAPGGAPPDDTPSGYRPSKALRDFVRVRDLTCRFPNCDCPAEFADIDHTVAWPDGPTHPSNLKVLCRVHHLLKTFHRAWRDRQLADGSVQWTAPNGQRYTTKAGGSLFFPQLAASSGELVLPAASAPAKPGRGLTMPTRRRTRAEDRAYRIEWERGVNRAQLLANPPPF